MRKEVWFSIISVETAPAVAVGFCGAFQGSVLQVLFPGKKWDHSEM